MVGIAGVAAHGDAGQLAHKVVLQTGADDLFGVVEIFRPDEAHDGVDQERLIPLGKAVAPGLHGHLVRPIVGLGGQLGALAGLEIHDVGAGGGAVFQGQLTGLLQKRAGDAEGLVALLGPGDGLENQVRRRALTDGLHLGGHMAQDADLSGNLPAVFYLVKQVQNSAQPLHGVRHRVQAQHRVARAEGQALHQRGQDAVGIVGGVIGLEAAAEGAGEADGCIAVGGDANLSGGVDQVQVAHELGNRRHHLRRQAPGHIADLGLGGVFRQQPLPQLRHGPVADLGVDRLIDVILDDAGDLVVLIGDHGIIPQVGQQQVGQDHLGRHPFLGIFRRDTCQLVTGFFLIGLGQNLLDGGKGVGMIEEFGF